MQFKSFLEAIIGNIYILLGITLPPCFCCTGEYNYTIIKFLEFHFSGAAPSNLLEELGHQRTMQTIFKQILIFLTQNVSFTIYKSPFPSPYVKKALN